MKRLISLVLLCRAVMYVEDHSDDAGESLTPNEVRERVRDQFADVADVESGEAIETPFTLLLTPESRARIVGALVEADGEPLSASRICEVAGVSRPSFARQEEPLLALGVMVEVDKVGNARRFALNQQHPAAQLLWMLDRVLSFGETDQALATRFIAES